MISSSDILKASILIVDDQEAHSSLLEQTLRGAGYVSITTTNDPRAVFGLYRTNHFSLVLLDLQMPGLDGFQIMEGLKASEPGDYLPVLVLTAQPDHKLRALKAGAMDFVSKPFDLAEVVMRVHNLLEVRLLHAEADKRTKQAETREQVSAQLAAIVNFSSDAIIGKDLNGLVTSWNKGAEKIFGFSAKEMIGQSITRLIPLDRQTEERQIIDRVRNGETVEHFDTVRVAKDGHLIDIALTVSPIKDNTGKTVGASKVARDITERKHAQDEIHRLNQFLEQRVVDRTAQLQDANKELEAFSYSVSHDLRTPLRHVIGYVDLLKECLGTSLSEESLHHLLTISQAAQRMRDLIDNLLAFSKLGRTDLRKSEIDLDSLIQDILKDIQGETKERNIAWDIHPLPHVQAHRALLRMVLVNLISNAVKFTGTRAGAKIEIGCSPSESGETVTFIRDNGVGFDPVYADKLFGVFQRLHHQEQFEGTGIGLANVQRIIHRHGGRVWAEGVVDGGATFYFSLPNQVEASIP